MNQFNEPWTMTPHGEPGTYEVTDAAGNCISNAQADAECPLDVEAMYRAIACVNFCRQFPTEALIGRQAIFLKDKESVAGKSMADIGAEGIMYVTPRETPNE